MKNKLLVVNHTNGLNNKIENLCWVDLSKVKTKNKKK